MIKEHIKHGNIGWGIKLGYMPSLAGIYFNKSLPHREMGITTLVFRTRKQAREQLKKMDYKRYKHKVVRVMATIEIIDEVRK